MAKHAVDKKLEGRLFDLLEARTRIRLGQLVQIRRRARDRGRTMLQVALDAGLVEPVLARRLAQEAGLPDPFEGEEQNISNSAPSDDSMSDSMFDSMVDAPPDVARRTRGSAPPSVSPPEGARRARASAPPAGSPPPMPILRAPPAELSSRNSMPGPSAAAAPRPLARPPSPPPPPRELVASGPPRDLEAPRLRAPSAPPEWSTDRATVKLDEPAATPRVLDRIAPPRAQRQRNTPAAAWDEGADTSRGADGRRRTPPVPGHERATPVPPAAPARAGRLVDPGPEVIDSADLEPLSDDSGDAWGDTAPPIGAGASDSPDEGLPDLPEPADRYAIGDEIGRGGMGLILEARDLALDRPVALKLLHDADQKDPALRLRFMDEARVTGQLQHPGVPPVYDLGRLGDGRLFFAMKRIEGRTLRDVIEDLREQDAETTRLFGRVRLLTLFAQICRAMAYAHSRGVMHRDLKPDNVMLGEFGEVTVMDWGLAKPIGGDVTGDEPIATARETESRFQTLSGEVTGTPQYMAPEQAAGRNDKVGAHSDIYSLGALLYELLTLEPPFDGPSLRVVRSAVLGDQVVPPSRRAPDRDIPFAVEQLCLQCLSKDPGHRPRSAAAVADQIERFLEGEQDRARREAERKRLLEAGTEAAESYYSRFEQQRQLQAKTAKMRAKVAPWAPVAERSRLWNQEDAEMAARIAAAHSLSEALVAYHAALEIDREHPAARRALCSLYYSAFETAERDDDKVAMALYEQLVRAFDDEEGFFSDRLKGDGRFELQTLPAGVTATLYSYRLVDRVLTPVKPRALGLTPAVIEPMPMGSYLLKLHAPGLAATAVPVYISRQERLRLRLRLFPDHARGADFVHVAFGPARLGGDPHAQLARPARTQEVDDFFIARRPVSAAQYREFLHALLAADGPTIARARAPRETPNGPPLWPIDLEGRFIIPDEDAHGMPWHPDWPVVNVSFEDAEAYCQWLDTIEGPGHRLPTEVEWEKAARGADGRLFPWGDTWEPTFCHMGISRPGPPARGAGGAFATDVSPYGVEDLAGGVSEWTSTWMEGARQRVIKGGHWASGPTECRAASRFTQAIDRVLPTLGFRVARSAPT